MFYKQKAATLNTMAVKENMKFLDEVKPGALLQIKIPGTIYQHPMPGTKEYKGPMTSAAPMLTAVNETMMILSKEKIHDKVDVKVLYKGEVKYITLFPESALLQRFFKIL